MTDMDEHARTVVRELARAMEAELVAYTDAVQALIEAGVERCHADFCIGTTTYYMPGGSFEVVPGRRVAVAKEFTGEAVQQAVHAGEQGEIGYRMFCERLGAA